MSLEITTIIVLAAYKIASLLVGLVICYFGYKLFLAGVWGNAGDLNARFNNNKIVLKSAAPGTFFVLFGSIVIALTIYIGLKSESHKTEPLEKTAFEAPPTVPDTFPPIFIPE